MKTSQKGFISPLLLALIAIFLAGGAYVYLQNKQSNQPVVTIQTTQATSTAQASNSQTASDTSVTLTTTDICSPLLKDASTLLFIDNNEKTWIVDYRNASLSEYSLTTGNAQGTDGLLQTTLQDWLKSLYRVGQPQAEICGAPGSITITGTLNASGVLVASSIKVNGQ